MDSDSDGEWDGKPKEELSVEAPHSPDGKSAVVDDADEMEKGKEDELKTEKENDELEEGDSKKNGTSSQPRELHRTASIFLRNLAPTITKLEVEAVNKGFDFNFVFKRFSMNLF